MIYYIPVLTYTTPAYGGFNSIVGGIYTTEKKAVDALIEILVRKNKSKMMVSSLKDQNRVKPLFRLAKVRNLSRHY